MGSRAANSATRLRDVFSVFKVLKRIPRADCAVRYSSNSTTNIRTGSGLGFSAGAAGASAAFNSAGVGSMPEVRSCRYAAWTRADKLSR